MHGQHLGTGQHIVGSTLVVLCKDEKKFGNFDLATSLKHAWLEFKAWCKFRSISCSMGMFTPQRVQCGQKVGYAFLTTKAANCRICIAWLAELLGGMTVDANSSPYLNGCQNCVNAINACQGIIDTRDMFMEPSEAALCVQNGYTFLHWYSDLACDALARNRRLFKIVTKFHKLAHALDDLAISPLRAQGFTIVMAMRIS